MSTSSESPTTERLREAIGYCECPSPTSSLLDALLCEAADEIERLAESVRIRTRYEVENLERAERAEKEAASAIHNLGMWMERAERAEAELASLREAEAELLALRENVIPGLVAERNKLREALEAIAANQSFLWASGKARAALRE